MVSYNYDAWVSLLMTEHGSDYTINLGNGRNYNGNKIAFNSGVATALQANRSFRVITGIVDNAFGGTGGGTQYVMRYSVEKLIEMGWLVVI